MPSASNGPRAWTMLPRSGPKSWMLSGVNGSAVLKDYMDTMRAAGATPVRNWDQE